MACQSFFNRIIQSGLLACVTSAAWALEPIGNENFTSAIANDPDGHFQLVEPVFLNRTEPRNLRLPFNGTFRGTLDGNGYRIYSWTYDGGNKPAALFNHTDEARFYNITLENFRITGNPVASLVITGDNTQVNGIRVGGVLKGWDGNGKSDVSGVMHTGTNTTVSNVWITGTLEGGSGNFLSTIDDSKGSDVSGVMHTGTHVTISDVQVIGSLKGGDGRIYRHTSNNFYYVGNGGDVSGVMHTGTNTTVSNVRVTGTLESSDAKDFGPGYDGGGDVSGVMHTGIDTTVSNVRVTGTLESGSGSITGNGDSGDVSGIMHTGIDTTVSDVRVTGILESGSGGGGGNGDSGDVSGVMHTGMNTTVSNVWVTGTFKGGGGGVGGGDSGDVSGVMHTGTDTTVSDVRVTGTFKGGGGSAGFSSGNAGDLSGVMHTGTNTTVSDVRVTGTFKGGGGGLGRLNGGDGSNVSGVMHTGMDTTVSDVLVTGTLEGGNGGNSDGPDDDSGHGGNGGDVSGVMHTGTNITISDVLVTSILESGNGSHGNGGGSASSISGDGYGGGNGGNAGDVSGVMHTGTNTTVSNVLVTGILEGGNGGNGGNGSNGDNIYDGNGNGGNGGNGGNASDVSGVMYISTNTIVSDVLVTSTFKSGSSGSGGNGGKGYGNNSSPGLRGNDGDAGDVSGVMHTGNNQHNTYYDSNVTTNAIDTLNGRTTAELKMNSTYSGGFGNWRIVEGKYPFPEAVDDLYLQARINETVPLDCGEYACPPQPVMPTTSSEETPEPTITTTMLTATPTPSPNDTCLFTPQSPGTLEYLLYIGQRYHGVVKAGSGLAYWIAYKNDSYLALGPCKVYGFTELLSTGIVVDAAVNHGNSAYVAYHDPAIQPVNSMLAMLTLSEGQPQPTLLPIELDSQITSLSVDESDILLNTGQVIYRLSSNNQLTSDLQGRHALRSGEVIQSVSGKGGDLYLLTHEPETGYRIRTVPRSRSGIATFLMVTTSSGITTSKQVIASLKISGDRLHLLMIDSGSVIWQKYRLETLENTPDEAQESKAYATLPRNITPAAITLLPGQVDSDSGQDQVFIMGQNSSGKPRYDRLTPADFTSSPDSNGDNGHGIGEWPWWAKTLFGTGVSITGLAAFTTISCLVKKGWNYHRHRGGKPDVLQRIYQQLKQQNQCSTQDRQGQHRAGLPLLNIPPRPGFRGNPDGSNAISVEPVYIQPNGLGQKPSGYLDIMPPEAQLYQQPIAPQYEEIVPREERVPQIAQPFGTPNEVHYYEDLEAAEVRATEQRHEYYELEPVKRLGN